MHSGRTAILKKRKHKRTNPRGFLVTGEPEGDATLYLARATLPRGQGGPCTWSNPEEGKLWAQSALHPFPNHRWLPVSSSLLSLGPLCPCPKVTTALTQSSGRSLPRCPCTPPGEALCGHAGQHGHPCPRGQWTHPSHLSNWDDRNMEISKDSFWWF